MLQHIIDPNDGVTADEVSSFCKRRRLDLPLQYQEFLTRTNGGQPVPAAFPIRGLQGNPYGVVQAFFGIGAHIPTEDVDRILDQHEGLVPAGIVPIATTGTGDYIVLDLRKPSGPVFFWDRRPFWGTDLWNEKDLYPIADDFRAFLNELHERSFLSS
jgi:hypothetical protein